MNASETSRCRVAHLIYSRHIGGSEMVAASVCNNLDLARFSPVVLFMNRSSGPMPEVLDRLAVAHHGLEMTRFSFLTRPFTVARVLNRLKVELLHVHHVPLYRRVAMGARMSRIKGIVLTEHAKYSISRSTKLQAACRSAAKHVSHFTTVSTDLKGYFVSELGIPADRIKVVMNGVDTKRFRPAESKKALDEILQIPPAKHTLLSVGRLCQAKDQLTLLRAIKRLEQKGVDVRLGLIGDGELSQLLNDKVAELKLGHRVELLGNSSSVDRILPHADLFVLSSRREGLPMALLEAMACGLPIVSTAVGGIPEVIADGVHGYLVPPETDEVLAERIETLLGQPDVMCRMGAANRRKIEYDHSMMKTAETYAALYDSIASHGPGR
jgi:glycosyltransferase involved in cell wall biosynthesis